MKKLAFFILFLFLTAGIFYLGGCSGGDSGGDGGGGEVLHSISGTVVDTQNYSISGMSCTLNSTTDATQTVTSDSNGSFTFSNLSEGNYNILCDNTGYIPSRYYITVTSSGTTYKANTSVKMVVLTPDEYDSYAGSYHLYDPYLGYIMPLVLDTTYQEMAGVSFSSQPAAIATGYIDAGIDWSATSTFAYQGRAILEVEAGPSYTVSASMSGANFTPGSFTLTPQQGEITLVQFRKE